VKHLILLSFILITSVASAQTDEELWNSFQFYKREFSIRYIPQTGLPYDVDPVNDFNDYIYYRAFPVRMKSKYNPNEIEEEEWVKYHTPLYQDTIM
jgi:hypothetical protein